MADQTTLDLADLSFWDSTPEERAEAFAVLRRQQSVARYPMPATLWTPEPDPDDSYWAVLGYEDIRALSRDQKHFTTTQGVQWEDLSPEIVEASTSFLGIDDPRHAAVRALVSSGFTPKQVRLLEEGIRRDAEQLVAELDDHETGDFVQLVSRRLPTMTIMRMIGVPEGDHERLADVAEAAVSWNDPEFLQGRNPQEMIGEVIATFHQAAIEIAQHRAEHPADDLMTAIVQAEVDGQKLTLDEIGAFFVLLSVAGNDTTRQATSHTMLALTRFPDQRRLLTEELEGRIDTAIEEFVRFSTPVMTFRRTATADTEIGGQQIAEGDRVVMFYASGNRDEAVFDDPDRFDVLRNPNRHLGFGGGGAHYCMGAPLAKLQLHALFTNLLRRYPDLEVGAPQYMVGNFIDAISGMEMQRGARAE
ncbi:MAG TPA: cytochrome P450 [Solirubrobacteraceae bacterium]|jgi:cytochrome P450|nr:cytochrome P450 [Solirubrobacteraceae bacterium]